MSGTLSGILQAIHAEPGDDTNWLVLADWLEENLHADQAELLRLHRGLRGLREGPQRRAAEERIQALLLAGTRPCLPTRRSSIGMELVLIPAGKFRMGSPTREYHRMNDEPLHTVRITRAFYLSTTQVTQAQYREGTGSNPSHFTPRRKDCQKLDTDRFPVESVSWHDAESFCRRLTRKERAVLDGWEYRLPTEAMWEYACRAWFSTRLPFHFGKRLTSALANFRGSYPFPLTQPDSAARELERPTPVGSYPPNAFGLYDMHGNVDEWVADWFGEEYYSESPRDDPPGPVEGDEKVIRGGSWRGQGEDCRAAVRIGDPPDDGQPEVGFRVALVRR